MSITFDPAKIVIQQEIIDENGNVIQEKKTLADHYKECDGCAYCD